MSSTKKKASADKAMNRPLPSSEDSTTMVVSKKDKASVMASNSAKVSPDKVAKKKNTAARVKKSESDVDNESDNETTAHGSTGGKSMTGPAPDADDSEMGFKEDEGSDDDYEGSTSTQARVVGRVNQKYKMKKGLKPNPNGRVIGRKLVMWHRPRMVEKLMLHLQYECHRNGIKLPWDKAVERLSSGSSGSSAQQHLNKLRDVLITEGHLVPPLLGKATVPQDPLIRGYVRDLESEKPTDTKVVKWGDVIEDRKENLEVEGVIRGSGNYRRGLVKALEKAQKASGERRNRLPVELRDKTSPGAVSNPQTGSGPKKAIKRRSSAVSSRAESLDPAEMASDEEYDPSSTTKKGKYGLRKKLKGRYKVEDSDDEIYEDAANIKTIRHTVEAAMTTPQAKRLKGSEEGHGLITPPSSKPVILHLRPDVLKRFPSGTGLKSEVSQEDADSDVHHSDEMDQDGVDGNGSDSAGYASDNGQDTAAASTCPQTPLDRQMALHSGYQGVGIHGLKAEYDKAILNGTDPRANGFNFKKAPASHSHHFGVGESRVSSAYKLAAPPAYQQYPHTLPRKSHSQMQLAGTSAGAFPTFHGNARGNPGGIGFGQYLARGYGGQNISTPQYGNAAQMMADPFYTPHNDRFTSGHDIFQSGNSPFGHNGLPTMHNFDGSNDTQAVFGSSMNFGSQNAPSAVAPASTAPATAFQVATASTTHTDEDAGDRVSEAPSSPAHYVDYMGQAVDDNKENRDYFVGGYPY